MMKWIIVIILTNGGPGDVEATNHRFHNYRDCVLYKEKLKREQPLEESKKRYECLKIAY